MRLLDQLDDTAETSESMFRRVLAKEDARRIRALCDLAAQTPLIADYLKNGLYIGWTRDDMRTWELKDQLTSLMEAIYAFQRSEGVDKDAIEGRIDDAWAAFNQHRMKILVHCL